MKPKSSRPLLTLATLAVALYAAAGLAPARLPAQEAARPAAAKAPVPMLVRPWEHLALVHEVRAENPGRKINRLGREGWELVGVTNFQTEGTTVKTIFYFKRPL